MSDLTFDQALAELTEFDALTVNDLRDLVARTSVIQLDTGIAAEVSVIYSGPLALNFHGDGKALSTGNVAVAMAEADSRIKIIDNTHVAKLLNSGAFKDAYISATGSEDLSALFSPSEGFWSNASERFASAAKDGDFFVIAPKPSSFGPSLSLDGGIFSRNELKTLLEGDGGGRINGIELSALRERYNALKAADPAAALSDATELLSVKSMGGLWSNLEVGTDDLGNVTVRADASPTAPGPGINRRSSNSGSDSR